MDLWDEGEDDETETEWEVPVGLILVGLVTLAPVLLALVVMRMFL